MPKPLFFMVLGAHGIYIYVYTYIGGLIHGQLDFKPPQKAL